MSDYFILIAGAFSAGKTTFIETISNDLYDLSPELWGHRVKITDNESLILIELTGFRKHDIFRQLIIKSESLIGCIFLVDGSYPLTFKEANTLIQMIEAYFHPVIIVAANKQDKENAWDAEAIQSALSLPNNTPVLPCIAHDKNMVKAILIRLCELYLQQDETSDDNI